MNDPNTVEYDIIPAPTTPTRVREDAPEPGPAGTTRDAVEAAIQKLSQRVDVMQNIRRMLAEAHRREISGPQQAKKKAKNRAKNKVAKASRKRNRR